MTANLHLGPIVRSLVRHKALFALVVLELASGFTIISCLILAAAWYFQAGHKAPGHDERDLVAVRVFAPAAGPAPAPALAVAEQRAQAERALIAAGPDVADAASVSGSAVDERWVFPVAFAVEGAALGRDDSFGLLIAAGPSVQSVLGFHWLEGGMPVAASPEQLANQVVITRRLRQRLFQDRPALGRRIVADRLAPARVVGVIDDVVMATALMPHAESVAFRFDQPPDERDRRYLVRARPGRRMAVVQALTAALGPSRPDRLVTVAPFDVGQSRSQRISTGLVVFLAIIAAAVGVMALVGAMSVASFLVTERRRQIGIRRALGATRADVVRHFLIENTVATALGTGLGMLVTSALFLVMQRVFRDLHFGWNTMLFTAVLLWVDATLAAMIPALRAADVPPSVASR